MLCRFVGVHALSVLRVVEALCATSDAMSARFTMGASVFEQNHHLSRPGCYSSGPPTPAQAVDERLRDWLKLGNGSHYT